MAPLFDQGSETVARVGLYLQGVIDGYTAKEKENNMADERIRVLRVTTQTGRTYFVRESDIEKGKLMTLPDFKRSEDELMTEEEYKSIPATAEARDFFAGNPRAGQPIGTRPIEE